MHSKGGQLVNVLPLWVLSGTRNILSVRQTPRSKHFTNFLSLLGVCSTTTSACVVHVKEMQNICHNRVFISYTTDHVNCSLFHLSGHGNEPLSSSGTMYMNCVHIFMHSLTDNSVRVYPSARDSGRSSSKRCQAARY